MSSPRFRAALLLAPAVLLLAPAARAADEGFMQRPTTVQHRRHALSSTNELAAFFDFSVKNKLTEHFGGTLVYSRNFGEQLALELLAGGGAGRLTGLVGSIRDQAKLSSATPQADLEDAGALVATGQLGLRWAPVYGKLNLSAEIPVHFNFYLAAGAGAAYVQYNSILACKADLAPGASKCPASPGFQSSNAPTMAFNVGGGFRFFLTESLSARAEVRDVMFPDKFNTGVILKSAASNPGTAAPSPGITHIPLIFLGFAWVIH